MACKISSFFAGLTKQRRDGSANPCAVLVYFTFCSVAGIWLISKAIMIPTVVSAILLRPKVRGLSSVPCVTVIQRNTTHIKNVPFSCFMSTEKLISGISRIDKHKYLNISQGIKYMFFSMSRTDIPHSPPMMVAISRFNASRKLSFGVRWMHRIAAIAA